MNQKYFSPPLEFTGPWENLNIETSFPAYTAWSKP